MVKLIGYTGVSTRQLSTDRQEADLIATGVRRDDLYVDVDASTPMGSMLFTIMAALAQMKAR